MPHWSIGFFLVALLAGAVGIADPASDLAAPARALCFSSLAMALFSLTRTGREQDHQDGWLHPS
jgi:uncharacterized membrane protein YtjA (UPF0391 family)